MDKSTFVDFKGLNHACPKDDFSLQTIELMVNATIGQEALSSNIGATYQHAMQRISDDMLHENVECYVDDLVV
ncbi:hypothetical protein AAG906_034151 [Vitis piasezkii]